MHIFRYIFYILKINLHTRWHNWSRMAVNEPHSYCSIWHEFILWPHTVNCWTSYAVNLASPSTVKSTSICFQFKSLVNYIYKTCLHLKCCLLALLTCLHWIWFRYLVSHQQLTMHIYILILWTHFTLIWYVFKIHTCDLLECVMCLEVKYKHSPFSPFVTFIISTSRNINCCCINFIANIVTSSQ